VLSPDQKVAYFRRFGSLSIHVLEEQLLAGYPEILLVINKKEKGQYLGIPDPRRQWHMDQSYQETPALDPFLYALEVLGDGSGDTYFADMTAPYEALSPDERERLDDLQAEHRYDHKDEIFKISDYQIYDLPGVSNPLVRTHPETGRKALYLGVQLVKRIIGISPDDSAKMLELLYAYIVRNLHSDTGTNGEKVISCFGIIVARCTQCSPMTINAIRDICTGRPWAETGRARSERRIS
jgi:taurine dioxygenase